MLDGDQVNDVKIGTNHDVHSEHSYSTSYWKFLLIQLGQKNPPKHSVFKEEIKWSIFKDDMIVHLENSKASTIKLLELMRLVRSQGIKLTCKN